jgi:hypothetical protein
MVPPLTNDYSRVFNLTIGGSSLCRPPGPALPTEGHYEFSGSRNANPSQCPKNNKLYGRYLHRTTHSIDGRGAREMFHRDVTDQYYESIEEVKSKNRLVITEIFRNKQTRARFSYGSTQKLIARPNYF